MTWPVRLHVNCNTARLYSNIIQSYSKQSIASRQCVRSYLTEIIYKLITLKKDTQKTHWRNICEILHCLVHIILHYLYTDDYISWTINVYKPVNVIFLSTSKEHYLYNQYALKYILRRKNANTEKGKIKTQ